MRECFHNLSIHPECRSIVFSGAGKGFTSGLDLSELTQVINPDIEDPGRKAFAIRKLVAEYQESINSVEKV